MESSSFNDSMRNILLLKLEQHDVAMSKVRVVVIIRLPKPFSGVTHFKISQADTLQISSITIKYLVGNMYKIENEKINKFIALDYFEELGNEINILLRTDVPYR
jgi:hypothetical protein